MNSFEPAAFFAPQTDGVSAWQLRAGDGRRIRMAIWPAGGRGTILLFNGRAEYCEKYIGAAAEFGRGGYAFATFDWRGQGLSERAADDSLLCHVDDFAEFQLDADAVWDACRAFDLPEPVHLLAHSMGGCIALRSLRRGLPVRSVHFSAPMWGIALSSPTRIALQLYLAAAMPLGSSFSRLPGGRWHSYRSTAAARRYLTSDPATICELQRQAEGHPGLAVGGPTAGWLNAALRECLSLTGSAPPDCPALVSVGSRERIVDIDAIYGICRRWPAARLEVLHDARHELMMERPEIRKRFFARSLEFYRAVERR